MSIEFASFKSNWNSIIKLSFQLFMFILVNIRTYCVQYSKCSKLLHVVLSVVTWSIKFYMFYIVDMILHSHLTVQFMFIFLALYLLFYIFYVLCYWYKYVSCILWFYCCVSWNTLIAISIKIIRDAKELSFMRCNLKFLSRRIRPK